MHVLQTKAHTHKAESSTCVQSKTNTHKAHTHTYTCKKANACTYNAHTRSCMLIKSPIHEQVTHIHIQTDQGTHTRHTRFNNV